MKSIARFFLILFIAFLSTPTIVKLIEKTSDTSIFFSMSEEEQVKKEVKNFVYFDSSPIIYVIEIVAKRNIILSENISKHDNISKKIVSPPPDLA
ncbi:hypothetical protein [Flavobacterium nitratireducens]|uniref:hypothetical protein n=1 Tax=Flavobacterium nitratireducens TaxID=992289 RepID=UPI0024154E32|nr:hypothetical protein [Flavobacterium nitratireducens]